MRIHSSSPIICQALRTIEQVVIQYGGSIHPDLCVNHDNAMLSVSCPAGSDSGPLLIIPDRLFIPVTQLEWFNSNGALAYKGNTSSLRPEQIILLDAMVALYNATDKMTRVIQCLPTQLLPEDPVLLKWLMNARPAFALHKMDAYRKFIRTRAYYNDAYDGIGYLMPIIDLINHHPYVPSIQQDERTDWLVPVAKPDPNSDECFQRYNKSDSLSLATWHGYFESNTRHLAALDCVFQHPILGEIHNVCTSSLRRKINTPRVFYSGSTLTIQDIVLEGKQLPALRTLLGLAVRSKRRDLAQPEAEVVADELIQLLVEANIHKYAELQELCRADAEHFPLRPLFGQVARHQLALLSALRAA